LPEMEDPSEEEPSLAVFGIIEHPRFLADVGPVKRVLCCCCCCVLAVLRLRGGKFNMWYHADPVRLRW